MNSDRKKRRPASIELDKAAGELAIAWRDGHISRFDLAELRGLCPCANCQEQRQKAAQANPGQLVLLDGDAATATAEVRSIERVGHYAIRITWADGHDHGMYMFEKLRELDEGGE